MNSWAHITPREIMSIPRVCIAGCAFAGKQRRRSCLLARSWTSCLLQSRILPIGNVDSRYCQLFGHWPALGNSRDGVAIVFAIRFDATGANAATIMAKWDLLPLTCFDCNATLAASKARAIRSPNKKRTPRTEFSKKEKRRVWVPSGGGAARGPCRCFPR